MSPAKPVLVLLCGLGRDHGLGLAGVIIVSFGVIMFSVLSIFALHFNVTALQMIVAV
jgi:hypothetical protein